MFVGFRAISRIYHCPEPVLDRSLTLILTLSERDGSLTPLDQARREVDLNLNNQELTTKSEPKEGRQ